MTSTTSSASAVSGTFAAGRTCDPYVRALAAEIGVEQILGLNDAEHLFRRAGVNGQSRMNTLHDHSADIIRIIRQIDHVHFAARRHDRSNRTITQPHDAGDHRAFARLDHTGGFRLRHQGPDLFIRDAVLGLRLISECPQDRAPGNIQERDNGGSDPCDGRHGRRHSDGDFFRIAQRDLLRHKFADHQGKVGDNGDDQANADSLGKPAGRPSWANHSARRSPSVAPEKAPDRTPTRVIPIWTVDRNRPGSLASARARRAPMTSRVDQGPQPSAPRGHDSEFR